MAVCMHLLYHGVLLPNSTYIYLYIHIHTYIYTYIYIHKFFSEDMQENFTPVTANFSALMDRFWLLGGVQKLASCLKSNNGIKKSH